MALASRDLEQLFRRDAIVPSRLPEIKSGKGAIIALQTNVSPGMVDLQRQYGVIPMSKYYYRLTIEAIRRNKLLIGYRIVGSIQGEV